ncbi:type I restriction enzyme endonuclease domain-containing protein [uncultured Thermosynechococcus sp.]|uniref:type I restriction enzyme endonuclease domain-containing protein n=1 Tax=uncultured Thermosynechococcus sp. TaxID=436945 RepID=UPI002605FDF3|nr:type I restriction enzyme endonuclease domain-containing protein [uncultured Thermosynechococcus sp.]
MTKNPRVYLAHIMECIQKIERFTADAKNRFLGDEMVQDAVLRKYGYPPDKQEKATQTVLEQAEVLSAEWAAG